MNKLYKSRSQGFNINKTIKLRTTKKDFENNPALSQLIKNEKRIKLEPLTNIKSYIIPKINIRNEKKLNLIKSINSFKHIYQNYCKSNLLNDIKKIHKENKKFDVDYTEFKNRKLNNYSQNLDIFAELKEKYNERNFKIPNISSNKSIFNPNVLILKDSDLYKYIDLNLGIFNKKKSKSLNYLEKIKKEVEDLKNERNSNKFFDFYFNKYKRKEQLSFEKNKNLSSPKLEIEQSKQEILKTRNTYNNLSNIDDFFYEKHNNYNSIFEKLIFQKKISRNQQNENNIENSTTCDKISCPTLYNKLKKKTNTTDGTNDEENKTKNNVSQFIKLFPSYFANRIVSHTSDTKKIVLKFKTPLEKLYNKVSSSDNQLKFDKTIKRYLKNRGLNTCNDVSAREICKDFSNLKIKLFKKDFFNKDYELRKMNSNDNNLNLTPKQINKLNQIKAIKNELNNSKNKMVEIFCNYANNDN